MNESDSYKYALRDIVFELIEHAKNDKSCNDPDYRSAMLHALGLLKSQAKAFDLDLKYLGLADFDPELWYARS